MTARRLLPCLLLLLAGCGGAEPDALRAAASERYEATGTVLESPEHGPELCLGGVAESMPPQCGGVQIANWDWTAVDGEQSVNGTTWGEYSVVGSFDGAALTLTEPPSRAQAEVSIAADTIHTPCPEPPGGWQVADAERIDEAALQEAVGQARAQPDHAGFWIDHLAPPTEQHDGARTVVNAAFTGDVDRHEAELRAVWGGPLCVVQHARTLAELQSVQDELFTRVAAELGLQPTAASVSETRNVVQLGVIDATPEQRAAIDRRYGAGVVELDPGLRVR